VDVLAKTIKRQVLLISICLIAYLGTLTSDYYWDGITFALQIEKVASGEQGPRLLFHQNHLLFNAVGYLIYQMSDAIGFNTRALYLLQVTNTFTGVLAVGILFKTAERIIGNSYVAFVAAAGFAVSAVWWKIATDANAYSLSILLMLLCISNLFSTRPRWYLAGLALAGAMLIHQLASLVYPATVVAVFSSKAIEHKARFAIRMSSTAWLFCISIYYVCAVVLHNIINPLDVLKWATSNPSGVTPSLNPIQGLLLLPRINLDSIIGHRFGLFASEPHYVELLFAVSALVAIVMLVVSAARKTGLREILRSLSISSLQTNKQWGQNSPVLATWIGAYVIFLVFWEPWQVYYRAFYIPAVALLVALLLSNYHCNANRTSGVAALAVCTLMLVNFAFYIGPLTRPNANKLIAEARNANNVWDENTVIYFADRKEADTTFEYFNDKTRWRRLRLVNQLSIEGVLERISKETESVWLNKGVAESVDRDWLARHEGRRIEVTMTNETALYVEILSSK
jgi:hypothetical protein